MGVRGELFSTRLILPNRTYFFNVKENRLGDLYLNIVESKNQETGGFERQSVIVFGEDLPAFLGEFDTALKVLEKSVREQKRGKRRDDFKRDDFKDEDETSNRPKRSSERGWNRQERDGPPPAGRGKPPFRKDSGSTGYSGSRAKPDGPAGYPKSRAKPDGPAGYSKSRAKPDGYQKSGGRAQTAGWGASAEGYPKDKSRGGKRVVIKKRDRD